jgi:hypothetical protein
MDAARSAGTTSSRMLSTWRALLSASLAAFLALRSSIHSLNARMSPPYPLFRTAMNAFCGTLTLPNSFIRFLPSF